MTLPIIFAVWLILFIISRAKMRLSKMDFQFKLDEFSDDVAWAAITNMIPKEDMEELIRAKKHVKKNKNIVSVMSLYVINIFNKWARPRVEPHEVRLVGDRSSQFLDNLEYICVYHAYDQHLELQVARFFMGNRSAMRLANWTGSMINKYVVRSAPQP